MAKTRQNNYKLSCVGVDNNGNRARFSFFVYGVEDVEAARDAVRSDKRRRKLMKRQNVDWRTATLRAVRCSKSGNVGNGDRVLEEQIESQERQEQNTLVAEWKEQTHWVAVENRKRDAAKKEKEKREAAKKEKEKK